MCARFTLAELSGLARRWPRLQLPAGAAWPPRYNVAPTDEVLVVRDAAFAAAEPMRWGLVPAWSGRHRGVQAALAQRLINARGETLHAKPAFREALKLRRAVVLADGFYEWRRDGKHRVPHRFTLRDGAPLAFAALWEPASDVSPGETVTIVTTAANELVAPLHDRMPALLDDPHAAAWLGGGPLDGDDVAALLRPFPAGRMHVDQVGEAVNRVGIDRPDLIVPRAATPPPPTLFDLS